MARESIIGPKIEAVFGAFNPIYKGHMIPAQPSERNSFNNCGVSTSFLASPSPSLLSYQII
jgi:hypothetical protein